MSQNTRATGARSAVSGQDLERLRIGPGEHVALLHAAEAVDGRAVEGHALLEGVLQFGRRDVERLGDAKDVGEPQLNEPDASLLDGAKDVVLLALHVPSLTRVLAGFPRFTKR